jgi:ABC-type Fe3+ transport system permease subunit
VRARLTDRRELVAELMAATAHLARVGNNLNQVARTLNAGGEAVHAEVVLRLIARAASRVEEAAQQLAQKK